jgi:SNF2 family DNA or RNA helicase
MDCVQYNNWKARVRINWFGDLDTMKDIWIMIQHAQRSFKDWHGDLFYVHTDEEKKVDGFKLHKIFPEPGQNHNTELRNVTNQLSKLSTELVARRRGLRFFKVVRHIQQISANIRLEASDDECVCSKCGNTDVPTSSASVLSLCGHVLCKDCVSNHGKDTECPTLGCNAVNKDYQIVQAAELGVEDITTLTGEHYGKKIENIIDLIKKVPKDDQVIVFVQFSDLMDKIEAAIEKENISIVALGKKVEKGQKLRSDATLLDDYKKDVSASKKKVLLLNIGNASAAGRYDIHSALHIEALLTFPSNLTNANHIIFVSPYLTERQYTFDAAMIQAIGRARRYGQSKVVHIYHFLSLKTIDVDTLQARKPGKLLAANAAPPPAFVPYRGFKPSGFFLVDNNGNNTNEFGSPVVAQDFAGGED